MKKSTKSLSWVVYRMTIHGKPSQMSAVCEQYEWEAMERAQPGHHTLIQAGITNEGEAERLARSGSVAGNTTCHRKNSESTQTACLDSNKPGKNEEGGYFAFQPEKLVLLDRAV